MTDSERFDELIAKGWSELEPEKRARLVKYFELVVAESERQNLTRLLSPEAFFEGHVLDVKHALASDLIEFPALDLGSGAGVPGMVAAIVSNEPWILSDSELQKAEFLKRAAVALELPNVRVFYGRAEKLLADQPVKSIVARAVGPVGRIFAWIKDCSTWNNLVLFKGPKWEEEWSGFQASNWRGKLEVSAEYPYSLGSEQKKMRLVKLTRVPRGTNIRKKA